MVAEIPADKRKAVEVLREYGASQQKVADALGIDRSTVIDYEPDGLDRADPAFDPHAADYEEILPPEIEITTALEPEYWPDDYDAPSDENWTGDGPGTSPFEDEERDDGRLADDYTTMKPGAFIEEFFDDFEVGIKKKFVRMQAKRANRRGEIPDKDKMQSDIERMSSGVGNSNDALYIAEEYWAAAKQYLAEADAQVFRSDTDSDDSTAEGGDYVGPGDASGNDGQWVQIPGQGMQYGRWERGQNGAMQFVPMQPPQQQMGTMGGQMPQQQMGMNPNGGGSDPAVKEVSEKVDRLADAIMEDKKSGGGLSEVQSYAQQMAAVKETLDDLTGEGGSGEGDAAVRQLQQQLNQIRNELSSDSTQESFNDPRDQVMSKLLSRDDLDTESAMMLAEKMTGQDDPEVEKARIEKDLELKKLERQKERTETLVSGLEDALEKVGQGIGNAMVGKGQQPQQQSQQSVQQQQAQQPVQQQQAQQPPGQAAAPQQEVWQCPNCGAETEQDPQIPGVECGECDYSLMQCPDCHTPVEIMPASERSKRSCPECEAAVDTEQADGGKIACLDCEWAGSVDSLGPEVAVCDGCDSVHKLTPVGVDGGV